MNETERLINLIYAFLLSEDARLLDEVNNSYEILKRFNYDSYYITKYYRNVIRYEEFKIFQRKVFEILRCF